VKGRTIESTYIAALQALTLAEIDPVAHHERLRLCAQLLVDSQCANGQWDYAVKTLPDVPATGGSAGAPRGRRRRQFGDVLRRARLRACARAGVDIDPDVLAAPAAVVAPVPEPDGGWGYNENGARGESDGDKRTYTTNASYGSATAGGVASLALSAR
jgi:hypothetical protein